MKPSLAYTNRSYSAHELGMEAIIHLCSAHLLHGGGFYMNAKHTYRDLKAILHSIGFMVRSTDFALIIMVFCIIYGV